MTCFSSSCSDHGECLLDQCVCNNGWGSRGDFSPLTNEDCDQNYFVIQGLGIMIIVLSAIALPIKLTFTYLRFKNPLKQQKVQLIQSIYGICCCIFDSSFLAYGTLKLIDPEQYIFGDFNITVGLIGMDVILFFSSVFFFLLMHFASLNLTYFLDGIAKTMSEENQRRIISACSLIQTYGFLNPLMGIIVSFFPFLNFIFSDYWLQFSLVYLLGYWVIMVTQGCQVIFLLVNVVREMTEFVSKANNNDESTTKIKMTVSTLTFQLKLTSTRVTLATITWILFSLWPYLQRKFTYFYCCFYLFTYFTGLSIKGLWNFKKSVGVAPSIKSIKHDSEYEPIGIKQ